MQGIVGLRQADLEKGDFDRELVKRATRVNSDRTYIDIQSNFKGRGAVNFHHKKNAPMADVIREEQRETPLAQYIALNFA